MNSPELRKAAVVMTSIAPPNSVMRCIAAHCSRLNWDFILVGDRKSPQNFELEGCSFFSIEKQLNLGFRTAIQCPKNHYARKNVGYLIAMRNGANIIIETDDDNMPCKEFWNPRHLQHKAFLIENAGWTNSYSYFTSNKIWPRGFPLDKINKPTPSLHTLTRKTIDCPIQQGLADDNPDVDAIYRLLFPLPFRFQEAPSIALGNNSWCPFNSQNTTWFPPAFPLLYLPAHCSFRMTDIWRSLVAQRIAFANGWHILFHAPTVKQDRNEHDLLNDFKEEVPGYLNNQKIKAALDSLPIKKGIRFITDNMKRCYQELIAMKLVGNDEMDLLDSWIQDIREIGVVPGRG